jgi:hypothetical protein
MVIEEVIGCLTSLLEEEEDLVGLLLSERRDR